MATEKKNRTQVDRFKILRVLGEGAEGTVYLGSDTRLGRQVALKMIDADEGARPLDRGPAPSLEEARLISTLAHPNIVTLYDAGVADGTPYLVFEFVEGRTLAALIREQGRLDIGRAVEIAIALAQGMALAHERGIVHRDIKPGNVMITPEGVPRLMDFGIARRVVAPAQGGMIVVGTPAYMAPEYVAERTYLPASDVFALGVVLYEMLAGVPPIQGSDPREIVRRIVDEDFAPPSRANPVVDEQLDNLVMRALAKAPDERYPGAAAMAAALRAYLDPEGESGAEAGQGTLEYLLRRIRHKGDFPALSSTISAVNRAAISDREPVSVLCNSILRDVALTSRLLKIVNASALNQFGGSIGTVSRAVAILGYDTVRNVAMSLVLFEHMHSRANAAALKDQIVAAYFSGLLARELYDNMDLRDVEQAFICAMFHRLGRLLATFYLHEEAQVVERNMQTRGWDEARAAREVLGISYEDLGIGVARAWNFPDEILDSMRERETPRSRGAVAEGDRLRVLSSLANELADTVSISDNAQRTRRVAELVARYGAATGVTERQLVGAVRSSSEIMARDAEALGKGVARNGFLQEARRWSASKDAQAATAEPAPPGLVQGDAGLPATAPGMPGEGELEWAPEPGQRQAALAAGVQEITNTLVGDHPLNDVLRIILETMYRAIGFRRVLLFLADARQQSLRVRFGFGPDVEAIVKRGTAAPVNGPRDLFYAAIMLGNDLCIEDLGAEKVRPHVPSWYQEAIGARGMILLPIVNRKRTLGLIYADSEDPRTLRFTAEEMGLLRTLRNQALLAIRQSA